MAHYIVQDAITRVPDGEREIAPVLSRQYPYRVVDWIPHGAVRIFLVGSREDQFPLSFLPPSHRRVDTVDVMAHQNRLVTEDTFWES